MSPRRLVLVLCVAEVVGMLGFASFPALLPTFLADWSLSNTDAGWLSGIFFAGYMGAVPVLASLTDRTDPRRIYLASTALSGVAYLGFALLAGSFWSAMPWRILAGIGLAGTYMPGLKILSDRIGGPGQSRAVSFYTASFGVGVSVSFLFSGEVADWLDWRWAFGMAALGSFVAYLVVWWAVAPAPPRPEEEPDSHLLDFRPVFSNRRALGYILAYAAHNWELFAYRSWIVVFLAFSATLQPEGGIAWQATWIAALVNVLGWPASVLGNELATRFGRPRVVMLIMGSSALLACAMGFSASLPFVAVVALCLIYGVAVSGESGSLTAGAVAEASRGLSGTTMAVHASLGFAGAFAGPLVVGVVLDLAGGGGSVLAWGLAFVTMGAGVALGPLAIALLTVRGPRATG